MPDGYSDKSVTPITYQPDAANDPQATGGVYEPINDETIASAAYGATIVPTSLEWLFRKFGLPQADSFLVAGTGGAHLCIFKTSMGSWLVSNSYSRKIFRSTDNCQTWTLVHTGPTTSKVPAQIIQMISGKIISGTASSDDDGITWSIFSWAIATASYKTTNTAIGNGRVVATCGYAGTPTLPVILYSDDGVSWNYGTVTGSIADSDFHKTKYLGNGVWFCGGENGGFYISRDNAASWIQHRADATYYYGRDAERLPNGNIIILHQSGARLSVDDGVSFGELLAYGTSIRRQSVFLMGNKLFNLGTHYSCTKVFQLTGNDYLTLTNLMPLPAPFAYPTSIAANFIPNEMQLFIENGIVYAVIAINYSEWQVLKWAWNEEVFVDLPPLSVTPPAKLDAILTATAQLVIAGKIGTVKLYLQHTNDIVTTASSLADVAGAWTDCGALTHDTPLTLPDFTARSGEVIYPRIGFQCTDTTGVSPAPELASIAFAWSSDVTAPGDPTVTRIVNASGSGSYGYRVDFGDLPATARHLIVEGSKNGAAYVPFNNKAQWAAGTHMKLRGNRDVIEEAGERNETSLSSRNGFVKNDTVQVKVAAEDDVGNRSAFVESEVLALSDTLPSLFVVASRLTVPLTESFDLTWNTVNAASVVCDKVIGGEPLGISGTATVTPTANTIYTFTATNATGDIATEAVSILSTAYTPPNYVPVPVAQIDAVVTERVAIEATITI